MHKIALHTNYLAVRMAQNPHRWADHLAFRALIHLGAHLLVRGARAYRVDGDGPIHVQWPEKFHILNIHNLSLQLTKSNSIFQAHHQLNDKQNDQKCSFILHFESTLATCFHRQLLRTDSISAVSGTDVWLL